MLDDASKAYRVANSKASPLLTCHLLRQSWRIPGNLNQRERSALGRGVEPFDFRPLGPQGSKPKCI